MPKKITNKEKYPTGVLNPFDSYIKQHGVTRNQIHVKYGIPIMTLSHIARRSIERVEVKYILIIADMIHKNPAEVLTEMLEREREIDEKQGRE